MDRRQTLPEDSFKDWPQFLAVENTSPLAHTVRPAVASPNVWNTRPTKNRQLRERTFLHKLYGI